MAGHRNFEELRSKMSPESQARSRAFAQAILADMRLTELRRARELSQAKLAEILKTDQGNISRMEQRADIYISTLRKYVEAVGGSLDIVAHFPGGSVRISQFGDLQTEAMEQHKAVMDQFDSVFDELSK